MGSHGWGAHHIAPRCLLTLHQKANGTSLGGEGIQAWVEWEMEALRCGVPVEISRDDLEALVDPGPGTPPKAPETTSKGEERA